MSCVSVIARCSHHHTTKTSRQYTRQCIFHSEVLFAYAGEGKWKSLDLTKCGIFDIRSSSMIFLCERCEWQADTPEVLHPYQPRLRKSSVLKCTNRTQSSYHSLICEGVASRIYCAYKHRSKTKRRSRHRSQHNAFKLKLLGICWRQTESKRASQEERKLTSEKIDLLLVLISTSPI